MNFVKVLENRIGAFEMCTNLTFRLMMAIMSRQNVNWCQVLFKRLGEEVEKPDTTIKSFSLILKYILTQNGIQQSPTAEEIQACKFLGGTRPTLYNKKTSVESLPNLDSMPQSSYPRDISGTSTKTWGWR